MSQGLRVGLISAAVLAGLFYLFRMFSGDGMIAMPPMLPPAQNQATKPASGANSQAQGTAEGETAEAQGSGLSSELESFLEPYIFDPKGRRDPFRPYAEGPVDEGEMAGPLLPLQQYDLDQLRLVGIIWNVNEPKAMFVDPKSQIHIVRRDERIGRRNGYVAVIREGEVVVVEAVNVNGDLMYSTRVIKIKNPYAADARSEAQ
jgi:type IV pilus assembly protein PilP